jgi:hypothetical protein
LSKQPLKSQHAEAIRRMVELGLETRTPAKPATKASNKTRAAELAAKAVDKMTIRLHRRTNPIGADGASPRDAGIPRGSGRSAKGEEKMSGGEKSTDPGLTAAERKKLRGREAKEAVADHVSAYGKSAWHGRRPRGRCSIRRQSFPMTRPSKTSDFLRGSGTR